MRKAAFVVFTVGLSVIWARSGLCTWQNWQSQDGLADNGVNCILEDRSGAMWFGTSWHGVSRFDGVNWSTFWPGDNDVRSILEGQDGVLWFGTMKGVGRFDGSHWRTFTTADSLGDNRVASMFQDRSGALWVGTQCGGLSRYDGVRWHTFTTADSLAGNYVTSMLQDRSGGLWATAAEQFGCGRGGLSRYDGVRWHTLTTLDGLAGNDVDCMLEDRRAALWFGTATYGVSRFDGVNWHTFTTVDGLASNNVVCMAEDRSGALWFGTDQGVSRYDGVSWRTFTTADGLECNSVKSLLVERSGAVWVQTDDPGCLGGVSRYDGLSWHTFTDADGLVGGYTVGPMLQDRSGALWFGTSGYGVSRYDGANFRAFTSADWVTGRWVITMLQDRSGAGWFGTYGDGVARYDGVRWFPYTSADVLLSNFVLCALEDRSGALWFGTENGVSRYDGTSWRTLTTADSLASNYVMSMLEDRNGAMWFGTDHGVCRHDSSGWHTITTRDSLASDFVLCMLEDRRGNMWFGTDHGVSRYDGVNWYTFTAPDELTGTGVACMTEDENGNVWFGTDEGVSRYDGTNWLSFATVNGLAINYVYCMLEDRRGNMWFGTDLGLIRYDGLNWRTFTSRDGLDDGGGGCILLDRVGALWLDGSGIYTPDEVAPRTVFLSRLPVVSANRAPVVNYLPGFDERHIVFQRSLGRDSTTREPWSDWSSSNMWAPGALADGSYCLLVRARDEYDNVESPPESLQFEIDATPPSPALRFPGPDAVLRDSVSIRGTVADTRFAYYRLEYRLRGATAWTTLRDTTRRAVTDSVLAVWNTRGPVDGKYELRLSVADKLGLVGSVIVPVSVDNHFPYTAQTSPALVTAAAGGDVYTDDGAAHLYLPPHGLSRDTIVTVTALDTTEVPASLPDGAARVNAGYELNWGTVALVKAATLDMARPEGDAVVVYAEGAGAIWGPLGGTSDANTGRITVPVSGPGRYALFREGNAPSISGEARLSAITLTPRVFSPRGTYAATSLAIGFSLGRPGTVTVKIYNRAGRLVREAATGLSLGAGANVVRWDGRDREGREVEDGAYLVTIGAFGETQTRAVAVVR